MAGHGTVEPVIRRVGKNLAVLQGRGARRPACSSSATATRCCAACSTPAEVDELAAEIDASFDQRRRRARRGRDRDEFRYEMLNRSAACQARGRPPADPRGHRAAARRRLPRDRQHRVAQPARVRRRAVALRRRAARARGPRTSPWDDRIPYPVFAIGAHILLRDCTLADGPTAVVPGQPPLRPARAVRPARRSRPHLRRPPAGARSRRRRATCRCSCRTSWHRGTPATGGAGRLLPAGALRPARHRAAHPHRPTRSTSSQPEAIDARRHRPRARALVGLHDPFFYDG